MTEHGKQGDPTQAPILVTRDLDKVFGEGDARVFALKDVNLSVRRGEFLTVMGRSGSGKTTLLTLLGAIDTPSRGHVLIDGVDVATLDDDALAQVRRQRVGFVFQSFNLLPILSAEDNIALPLLLEGRPRGEALTRVEELMGSLGMRERRHHYPGMMSAGEQQRVAICRALAPKPPIVLADEPTGNLDTYNKDELIHLLRALVDDTGQTLVMVTHDVSVAAFSDRVVVLKDGEIQADLRGADVTADNLSDQLKAETP